jgi:uncharacterized protein involved in response to NO
VAIKFGGIPMLLPIYFTVCHRMIPFFTNIVVRGYTVIRPMWALGAAWGLLIAHTWLELRHAYGWLWMADFPLAVLFAGLLVFWWPRERMPPAARAVSRLCRLPCAFAVAGRATGTRCRANSCWAARPAMRCSSVLRCLLVAMVTRHQGHSGRPLVLGKVAATAFVIVQLVAVTRIVAEMVPDALGWQAVAAGMAGGIHAVGLRSAGSISHHAPTARPGDGDILFAGIQQRLEIPVVQRGRACFRRPLYCFGNVPFRDGRPGD